VLDLGCGPGSLTIPLARFSGTTIGIDPDPAMIETARQTAEVAGVAVEWSVGSSLELPDELKPLDLVTIARAFHWMDREATLLRLDELVRPGGAVALVNTEVHPLGTHTWHTAFEELRKSHGRFDAFYRWRKGVDWEEHLSVLVRSVFCDVLRISVHEAREASLDRAVVLGQLALIAGRRGPRGLRDRRPRGDDRAGAQRPFPRDRRECSHHRAAHPLTGAAVAAQANHV
jgi:SAM-dependent methyltransferase